jgi:hypothetical protein
MKQKIIKFFEELDKAPEDVEVEIFSENSDAEHVICEAAIIAPLAAQKLLEAVELLERARGWLSSELGCTRQLSDEISKFLEDFNND